MDDGWLSSQDEECEQDIANCDVRVAERDGALAGMVAVADTNARLEWLFVGPVAIGSGVGRALLKVALARAARRGIGALELESDPHAESVYLAHAAERIGSIPARSTGRSLPCLRIPTVDGEQTDGR